MTNDLNGTHVHAYTKASCLCNLIYLVQIPFFRFFLLLSSKKEEDEEEEEKEKGKRDKAHNGQQKE